MKLRVVSDGTVRGTQLINTDTGEPLGMVQEIMFDIKADQHFADCIIKLVGVEFYLEGQFNVAPTIQSPPPEHCENHQETTPEIPPVTDFPTLEGDLDCYPSRT